MINIFFKTYGCQANVADSQGLIKYLESLGCQKVATENQADLIMVNTCAIREKAEQKMFSYLGSLVEYKKSKPYVRIGVIGCVASYRKKEIYDRFDHVNFVFGAREDTGTFQEYLFDMVVKLETIKQLFTQSPESITGFGGQDRDIGALVSGSKEKPNIIIPARKIVSKQTTEQANLGGGMRTAKNEFKRSFVNITSGCNNYCTFCIVPFTRGREKSYSIDSITAPGKASKVFATIGFFLASSISSCRRVSSC